MGPIIARPEYSSTVREFPALILVTPAWPSLRSGYGLSAHSLLRLALDVFPEVHVVGMVSEPFKDRHHWEGNLVTWSHIPVRQETRWKRFLKSLFSPNPAVTMQFAASDSVRRQFKHILQNYQMKGRRFAVLFLDTIPACLLPCVRRWAPGAPVAVRSDNVLSKVFEKYCSQGPLPSRLAWWLEVVKDYHFERRLLNTADCFWTITEADRQEYQTRFGFQPQGVIGVSMNSEAFEDVPCGDVFTLLYLGSADLRKGKALTRFIKTAFQEIRSDYPNIRFLLGGRNTEMFNAPNSCVFGLGAVENETNFLSKGLIFVNPQEDGSGIQLKNITAMLACKALVTTEVCARGLEGERGKHFLVGEDAQALGLLVKSLLAQPDAARVMGLQARELARFAYAEKVVFERGRPILEELAKSVF